MNNNSVLKKVLVVAAGVAIVVFIAAYAYVRLLAPSAQTEDAGWRATVEDATQSVETTTNAPLDTADLTEHQRIIRAAQACESSTDVMPSDSTLLETSVVVDGYTFITHHCDSFTRVYVMSPEGAITYHVVGPRYYGKVLDTSPHGTFMVMQGCNAGGGCGSRIIDMRDGREAKFEYRSSVVWTPTEDRAITVSGFALGHDGVGLRIINTADMSTQRIDLVAFNADYATTKEITLQAVQGNIVPFTVMYYQGTEARTDMLTYNLATGQIAKNN